MQCSYLNPLWTYLSPIILARYWSSRQWSPNWAIGKHPNKNRPSCVLLMCSHGFASCPIAQLSQLRYDPGAVPVAPNWHHFAWQFASQWVPIVFNTTWCQDTMYYEFFYCSLLPTIEPRTAGNIFSARCPRLVNATAIACYSSYCANHFPLFDVCSHCWAVFTLQMCCSFVVAYSPYSLSHARSPSYFGSWGFGPKSCHVVHRHWKHTETKPRRCAKKREQMKQM